MKTCFSKAELTQAIQQGYAPQWCLFWGHAPKKDGSLSKACFSQWWGAHPFEIDGIRYPTAEHFMMAEKARLFKDDKSLSAVLSNPNPAAAKKAGRGVSGFDDKAWLEHRWGIVVRANTAKFAQHPELREFLIQTGQQILVEASPYDRIWGIGLSADHADAKIPQNWKGLNLLGFALMKVRDTF